MSLESLDSGEQRRLARDAIQQLMDAASTLMDEAAGRKATDWGVVNDAMVAGGKFLQAYAVLEKTLEE